MLNHSKKYLSCRSETIDSCNTSKTGFRKTSDIFKTSKVRRTAKLSTSLRSSGFIVILFSILIILLNCSPTKSDYEEFSIHFSTDTCISYTSIDELKYNDFNMSKIITVYANDIFDYTIYYLEDNPKRSHSFKLCEESLSKINKHASEYALEEMLFFIKVSKNNFIIGEYWPMPSGGRMYQSLQLIKYHSGTFMLDGTTEETNLFINSDEYINSLENAGINITYKNIGGSERD